MFWNTAEPHDLPYNPFKSCVVPRPIGWISTLSENGVPNLAPYSFFNGLSSEPPMVMFSSNGMQPHGPKDTITNVEATGEFVCNMVPWALRDSMNLSCAPLAPGVSEFEHAGLEMEPSELVTPPRVKLAPVHMECTYHQTVELPSDVPGARNAMVIGRVIGIHIKEEYLVDGILDVARIQPLARLGYQDYTRVDNLFPLIRPKA